jgi:hypothetical protein
MPVCNGVTPYRGSTGREPNMNDPESIKQILGAAGRHACSRHPRSRGVNLCRLNAPAGSALVSGGQSATAIQPLNPISLQPPKGRRRVVTPVSPTAQSPKSVVGYFAAT